MRMLAVLLLSPLLSVLAAQAAPVLGPPVLIGNAANATDTLPRVAYDYDTDRYCVVWNANNGAAPAEIHAQILNGSGTPIGAVVVVSTSARISCRPAIANIRTTGKFLVGWTESAGSGSSFTLQVKARSLDAGNATLSTSVLVGSFTNSPSGAATDIDLDIGGDQRNGLFGTAEAALVVWREKRLVFADIRCRAVQVPSTGAPVPGVTSLLSGAADTTSPQVTRHCGVNGRWGVVWPRGAGPFTPKADLIVSIVDAFGPCATHTLATMTSSVLTPSCATADGVHFAAAWSTSGVVRVLPFSLTGVCPGVLTTGSDGTPFTMTGLLSEPTIDFVDTKYAVACLHRSSSNPPTYRVLVKNLDPETCSSCGVEWFAETTGASQESPAVCAKHSGSSSADDRAMVAWSNGTIRGRHFEASTSSLPVNLGGSCGTVGFDDYATYDGHCVLGNDTFSISLFSPTSPILALVVGFSAVPQQCGPCTLIPSIDAILPGISPMVIPIPCQPSLIGGELYTQWLQQRPSGCPNFPDWGVSNALKFTIAE